MVRWMMVVLTIGLVGSASAEELGRISFPVTGSPAAQARFARGVMALHSFFYDEALDEFRGATAAEPGFAMGWWGEAMALNQTIWHNQDTVAGRAALGKIADTGRLLPSERAFIDAARILYGPGTDKAARDRAYAAAMERMAAAAPEDDEAQTFLALAILGSLDPRQPSLAQRMRAGALALEVLGRNPQHPGAAHYVIHAFDDADHASIALPAARRYAQIAPAAFHARHMPAHIFVNLAMWEDAAAACESAWQASDEWVTRRKHGIERRDYHSLSWLVFIYDQEGRTHKSDEMLARFADSARTSGSAGLMRSFAFTAVTLLQRRGHVEGLEKLLARAGMQPTTAGTEQACHAPPGGLLAPDQIMRLSLPMSLAKMRARAAATRGDAAEAQQQLALAAEKMKQLAGTAEYDDLVAWAPINELDVKARLAMFGKRWGEAETSLREAITLVSRDPYRGSADPAGMAFETLLGDTLLAAGKPREAAAAYADALRITPGDSMAILGAARAAKATGDAAGATAAYRRLAAQWKNADADLPNLTEVRSGAR